MSFDLERRSIETRFEASWADTPIKWPNARLTTKGLDEWVAIFLIPDAVKQVQIGTINNVYRYFSNVVVQVFIKPSIGSNRALDLATKISDIWRTTQFDQITLMTPTIENVGIMEGWYQIDVICKYHRDEYNSVTVIGTGFNPGFNVGFT